MLILSRKLNQSIVIDGRITVKIMRIDGDVVKLGIEAPPDVPVHRQEVYDEICHNDQPAVTRRSQLLPKLPSQEPQAPGALTSKPHEVPPGKRGTERKNPKPRQD